MASLQHLLSVSLCKVTLSRPKLLDGYILNMVLIESVCQITISFLMLTSRTILNAYSQTHLAYEMADYAKIQPAGAKHLHYTLPR